MLKQLIQITEKIAREDRVKKKRLIKKFKEANVKDRMEIIFELLLDINTRLIYK